MSYRVFMSHSVSRADYPLVQSLANLMWANGMEVFIPDWYAAYKTNVNRQVAAQIDSSDIVLALITSSSSRLTRVASELGYARGKNKEVIGLVENGLNIEDVLLSGSVPIARFDRSNFIGIAESIVQSLRTQSRKSNTDNTLIGLLIGGLILWALSQKGDNPSH